MLTELIFIANEMKHAATRNVVEASDLRAEFMKSGVMPRFPKALIREYNGFRFQLSLDVLSENKKMLHLSYRKLDQSDTSEDEKEEIELAFFGKKENILKFPGIHAHVYHMGELINA